MFECTRPKEMFWSKEQGKCVSLVGGRCEPDLIDADNCAGSSRCWENKNLQEFRCQCPLTKGDNKITYSIKGGLEKASFKPSRDRRNCIRSDIDNIWI